MDVGVDVARADAAAAAARRVLLGFLVCAALMAWALWLQYGLELEPCPLCMFQRVAVIAIGIVFLVAAIHNPGRGGAAVYAVLTLLIAGTGAALAACATSGSRRCRKDQVPACGMGLNYMLETLPLTEVIGQACSRAAASARSRAGCSSASRSRRGRSCSSSR